MKFYKDYPQKDAMIAYANMSKAFMNKPFRSPLDIVGNYDWHQAFPYERHLFFENITVFGPEGTFGDDQIISAPVVPLITSKVIDFGCGPGRMVERAGRLFNQVDGIDVSGYALDYARTHYAGTFYESSGLDVGDTPSNTYDLVFSTIAMQHIPSKSIRENIFLGFLDILKEGGVMSIQVAYNPTYQPGVWSADTEHADYNSDFYSAKATNGHADMVINETNLPNFLSDLSDIGFKNVRYELVNVSNLYGNLAGHYHAPYWASDWLFVKGTK